MAPLRFSLIVLTLTIASIGIGCHRSPKADLIVIWGTGDKGETIVIQGKGTWKTNPATGKLETDYFAPGTLYLFRQATKSFTGVNANPGELYRVDETGKLQKIGVFDLKKTDKELVQEHLSPARR